MKAALVPVERIERQILLIRGQKVLLDSQLAELYGVATGNLVRAMKRNIERFPEDFMFQLCREEFADLKCHFGTSSEWGGRRYPPYAFTEHGVAMLSSVLKYDGQFKAVFDAIRALMDPSDAKEQKGKIGYLSEGK